MNMKKLTVLVILVVNYYGNVEAAPKGSLVTSLPGFTANSFPSNHHAGYVTLDGKPNKNLYYYFVESEQDPSTDPLVLWLNGGPGTSSFNGFVYEHGPFNFEAGKSGLPILHLNPYNWSKVSSVIYLDSPAGVGFSYSDNITSYSTGDLQTAADTHKFLLQFKLYPEFGSNPFYLAGESFAGIYIPTLASNVIDGIKKGTKPVINFKGYMIGNGVTDHVFDGDNALVPFAHGMGLISDSLYQAAEKLCNGNYSVVDPSNDKCFGALDDIQDSILDLNIYNILEPCYHGPASTESSSLPESFKQLGKTDRQAVRKRIFGRRDGPVPSPQILGESKWAAPAVQIKCVNDEVATTWLNNDAVRKAIHASPAAGNWALRVNLDYNLDTGSMIPYHKNLTLQGYRALIYSGDHDMVVPYTGTQAWISSLGYKIVDAWRPWRFNNQVAGYTQGYEHNLTFLTIKGAGHTVPEYKPRESLNFYTRWLQGDSI